MSHQARVKISGGNMSEDQLRLLVSCRGCKAQYDATGYAANSRFHCGCGELVKVPKSRPHDAAVVRCSSCGAARAKGSRVCTFCQSDFTLRERDLHTICPGCATRISDKAQFCHSCALPITAQGDFGERTEQDCPACGPERRLVQRSLGEMELGILECPGCTGLWLGNQVFRLLEEKAQKESVPWQPGHGPAPGTGPIPVAQRGAFYRKCIVCEQVMHRRNYGKKSGVMIDTCAEHGFWFDEEELERILVWVRRGGHGRVQEEQSLEVRQRESFERVRSAEPSDLGGMGSLGQPSASSGSLLHLGVGVVSFLYDMLSD